jgi:hypothetical protein
MDSFVDASAGLVKGNIRRHVLQQGPFHEDRERDAPVREFRVAVRPRIYFDPNCNSRTGCPRSFTCWPGAVPALASGVVGVKIHPSI